MAKKTKKRKKSSKSNTKKSSKKSSKKTSTSSKKQSREEESAKKSFAAGKNPFAAVTGVGKKTAKKLLDAKIYTVDQLAATNPTRLKFAKFSENEAETLVKNAKDALAKEVIPDNEVVMASNVLDKVVDLHQRVAALELRVTTLEVRQDAPIPEHVKQLSAYIAEHLQGWTDENIHTFLVRYGHPPHHIQQAIAVSRRKQ